MIKRHFLGFEKPLEDISNKIDALEIVSKDNPELRSQIDKLQLEFEKKTEKIYSNLSRWNKTSSKTSYIRLYKEYFFKF